MSDGSSTLLRVRPIKSSLPEKKPPSQQLVSKTKTSRSKGLTQRQKLFIKYYREGSSAAAAARKAGYSESIAQVACSGDLLLYHPAVQAEIKRLNEIKFKALDFKAENLIEMAITMLQANNTDFVKRLDNGKTVVDLTEVTRDQALAIQEIGYDLQGNPRVRLEPKLPWAQFLAKLTGAVKDKLEVSGPGGGPITIEFLDKAVKSVTNNVQINIGDQEKDNHHFPEPVEQLQLSEG